MCISQQRAGASDGALHVCRAEPLPADFVECPGGHAFPGGNTGEPPPAAVPGNASSTACSMLLGQLDIALLAVSLRWGSTALFWGGHAISDTLPRLQALNAQATRQVALTSCAKDPHCMCLACVGPPRAARARV